MTRPGAKRRRPGSQALVTPACAVPGRAGKAALIVGVWLCCAAPVAGDIGSCNQAIEELDAAKFFAEKQRVDCQQCVRCDLETETCDAACAGAEVDRSFPSGCYPLAHDGEVCLRALRDANCGEYGLYVDDQAPETPTECAFCPFEQRPEGR